jgi:Fe-Mn family superoxide dismutase
MQHTLPQLPYPYDALEPFIDTKTLEIHHGKHHQAYVDKLNTALESYPDLQNKTVEELIASLDAIPEAIRTTVRNNAGGHFSHTLYWNCMGPAKGQGETPETMQNALTESFGTVETFKEQFTAAATNLFGSGWVWLATDASKKFKIVSTQGHDSPLMTGDGPIMVIDIWEHAYYLNYQNRRAEYIQNWWNVLDWNKVAKRYEGLL